MSLFILSYWSILDVKIDVFEQKPWKHPGADITDYFNFGLNEDSWKLYCNHLVIILLFVSKTFEMVWKLVPMRPQRTI